MVSRKVCSFILLSIGVVLLVVGCVLIPVFKNLIHSQIKKAIPLKEGGDTYKDWVDPPVPIYFDVNVFDLKNKLDVVNGEKPDFEQKGPYVYREKRHKFNITFNDNNTISYREARTFYFQDNLSKTLKDTDNFTTVNLPFLTIVYIVQYEYGWFKDLVNAILELAKDANLFLTLSVKDIMWGYEDNLLKSARDILKRFNVTLDDKFGLFYKNNGTDDGYYNIQSGTGPDGVDTFSYINTWNGEGLLNFWKTKFCNMLNGTDGTMFPPFVEKTQNLYVFSSDICRSIYLKYSEPTSQKGIDLYRFKIPPNVFESGEINPDNLGFCFDTDIGDHKCLPSGLLNVSSCRSGAPVVMSQPNFLNADKSVLDQVSGLHPSDELHSTILDVDPLTGVVMNAAKKLQINVLLKRIDKFSDTEKIKTLIFPVLWINERAAIDEDSANKYKSAVMTPIRITQGVQFGLIGVGGILLVVSVVMLVTLYFCKKKPDEGEPLISPN